MFSQINKPFFGTTTSAASTFGFASTSTSGQKPSSQPFGFFGSSSQQQPFGSLSQKAGFTNLFDQHKSSASLSFGLPENKPSLGFGGASSNSFDLFSKPTHTGTVTKFEPIAGTDSIQKNGIASSINTKLYCISCMTGYTDKSLEELRWEDYQCDRKGPQQPVSTTSLMFGQTQSKPTFGFGLGTQQGLFNKSTTFGLTSSATNTNTQPTLSFSAATTTSTTAPLFGSGSTLFGQTDKQSTPGLFSKFSQTTSSAQPPTFTFTQQTASQNSFEPTKFKISSNSFVPKSSPLSSAPTLSQPVQFGFGTTTSQAANKPLGAAAPAASPANGLFSQQQQPSLNIGAEFEQQMQEFHNNVQQIFQPFPRREFLKSPKGAPEHRPQNLKVYKELVEKVAVPVVPANISKLRTVSKTRGKRFAFFDATAYKNQPSCNLPKSEAKCLLLGKPELKNEQKSKKGKNKHVKFDFLQLDSDSEEEAAKARRRLRFPESNLKAHKGAEMVDISLRCSPICFRTIKSDKNTQTNILEMQEKVSFNSDESLRQGTASPQSPISSPESNQRIMHSEVELVKNLPEGGDLKIEGESSKTCPLKLERLEYYTVPPLHELHRYTTDRGECIIKGFTIGGAGYGKICFPDSMDVSNLDIDEIVHLEYREVTVYPDDSKKPPVGQGLNRRAQVTLERIWPLDKNSDKRLKDPEELARVNFTARLSLLAERQNATFLDYHPETGSWVFDVEHFSKFRFDDAEDEEVALMAKRQKMIDKQKEEPAQIKLALRIKTQKEMGRKWVEEQGKGQSSAKRQKNIAVMKSSLFGDDSGRNPAARNLSTSTATRTEKGRNLAHLAKRFALRNRNHATPILSLLTSRNYVDVGIFKGKSFKVGWGHGLKFTALKRSHLTFAQIGNRNTPHTTTNLEQHMAIALNTSALTTDNSGVPLCTVRKGWEPLTSHQFVAEGSDKQTWDLCLALWGPDASTPTARCELFSKWLEQAACPYVQAELKPHSFGNLFTYLSGHQLDAAARLAMAQGLPHLSALISQAGMQESVRELLYNQVKQWEGSGGIAFINKDILKLYMLLAGIPVISDLNVCENLDWKRALAVHLWYMRPNGISLINAIRAYQSGSNYVPQPYPEHYNHAYLGVYDIHYHIMLLYGSQSSPLGEIISPATHTNDPIDYRLTWLLLQAFTALRVGTMPPQGADSIHVNFSSQLESLGLWKWAVFVLLFIKDASSKTNAIMGVLGRNINPDRTCKDSLALVDSLVNDFKIPQSWIHTILAQKTNYLQRHIETFGHLIYVDDWYKTHTLAVAQLVPELMASGCCDQLAELLKGLIPGKRNISSWHTGAGLVLDILNLQQTVNETDIIYQKPHLTSLCRRMKNLPTNSPSQAWAMAELSRLIAVLLRIFYSSIKAHTLTSVQAAVAEIQMLVMPLDYKLEELRYVSRYLIE